MNGGLKAEGCLWNVKK